MRLNEFRSIVFLHVIKRICISFICIFICLIMLVVFSEGFYAENTSDISSENTQTQPSDGSRNDTDSHTQSEKEPKDIIAVSYTHLDVYKRQW